MSTDPMKSKDLGKKMLLGVEDALPYTVEFFVDGMWKVWTIKINEVLAIHRRWSNATDAGLRASAEPGRFRILKGGVPLPDLPPEL